MGWIVQSKESAEAAGADPDGDEVLFSITPKYIGEVYNRHRNNVYEDEPGFEDRWGMLSDEQKEELVRAIEGYIDQHLCYIDEDIIGEIDGAEERAAAKALE